MDGQKILYRGGEGEIVEKKSRFLATIQPVDTEEEAISFINAVKKKYWDATHNCSAFVVGEKQTLQRCSDDGEPSGTAGRPMLDVLLGEKICNVAVVVTRYFGGTLLGTGGLVRAYSKAVQEGLKHCTVIEKIQGYVLKIKTDYSGIGKIQYLLAQKGVETVHSEYTDSVMIEILVPKGNKEILQEDITEVTNGKAEFLEENSVCYTFVDGKAVLF